MGKKNAFGGVLIDHSTHQVLVYNPINHKGGYAWTFPKGIANPDEMPEEAALRYVKKKTGYEAVIELELEGNFPGETTNNVYFLMSEVNTKQTHMHGENRISWVSCQEARDLFGQTSTLTGKNRDLQVLELAYQGFEHLQKAKDPFEDAEKIEQDTLIATALRFDGYKYIEETKFDFNSAIDLYFEKEILPELSLERMTLFFTLQRFLYKWGGEMSGHDDPHWKLFRTLFLVVCTEYVPQRYRYPEYYEEWKRDIFPRMRELKAIIAVIHEKTEYKLPALDGKR